jgi:hypothetical protein
MQVVKEHMVVILRVQVVAVVLHKQDQHLQVQVMVVMVVMVQQLTLQDHQSYTLEAVAVVLLQVMAYQVMM